ncbi:hypothetical protein AB0442_07445 [Kitasatospora sp. NPDC085895]|uniref:hypothetical protein n=1 Tax=Kitasatospora sp. NPDC085895 TaxID=3155057 RepID=UPI00344E0604
MPEPIAPEPTTPTRSTRWTPSSCEMPSAAEFFRLAELNACTTFSGFFEWNSPGRIVSDPAVEKTSNALLALSTGNYLPIRRSGQKHTGRRTGKYLPVAAR